ncbi:MAG TPA: hypothetical protein VM911_06770 [Pyrinomonadaceae bacterium]|nr:hypothetical protein [Pyrinomonadaceae bacterium]
MTLKSKPLSRQVALVTGGATGIRYSFTEALARAGAIHVRNMARTLLFALSLDREVVLEDINIYARG